MELCCPTPRNAWGFQKLEEAGKDPLLPPSEGTEFHQHLDFGLLASRTVREYVSVILSHLVCGALLWQS